MYGLISTYNAFVFMKRQSSGILYMSRMIPNDSTNPTIMKLLYFFSHLCARDVVPCPETDDEGIEVRLREDTSTAPQIPNPSRQNLVSGNDLGPTTLRRSLRHPRNPNHVTSTPA